MDIQDRRGTKNLEKKTVGSKKPGAKRPKTLISMTPFRVDISEPAHWHGWIVCRKTPDIHPQMVRCENPVMGRPGAWAPKPLDLHP